MAGCAGDETPRTPDADVSLFVSLLTEGRWKGRDTLARGLPEKVCSWYELERAAKIVR